MVVKLSKQDWKNLENNLKLAIEQGKIKTNDYVVGESIDNQGFHYYIYMYAKLKEKVV